MRAGRAVKQQDVWKEQLAAVLGSGQQILDNPEILQEYSRDLSLTPPVRPKAVVKAVNKGEVQGVITWANQTGTPVVMVSSGAPHLRGDTVPSVGGAIILDLSGMKKIIRLDRRNRMALIEPGVTFGELVPEVAKEGLKLSLPLLPRASKSVLASVLEREPIMVPKYQWQLIDPLRFLEVVWGSGETLRTGEGGLYPAFKEGEALRQTFPLGPLQTDYYRFLSGAQGSMGAVVWAAIKCEVLPRIHDFFFIPSQRPEDLFDFVYKLLRFRFADELLLMNNVNLACILGETAAQIQTLKEQLPRWVCIMGIAGRETMAEERVEYQKKDISEIAQQSGLKMLPALPGVSGVQMAQLLGTPSTEPHWKVRAQGASQDIFFLTTLNKTPEFITTLYSALDTLNYPASDVGIYLQPSQQGASCHCEFTLPYNPSSTAEAGAMGRVVRSASEALLNRGAYFSRPYGIWAPMTYNRDAQSAMTLMKIKSIFDPSNVMNPGRLFDTMRSLEKGGEI